jgi:hypothetical protein
MPILFLQGYQAQECDKRSGVIYMSDTEWKLGIIIMVSLLIIYATPNLFKTTPAITGMAVTEPQPITLPSKPILISLAVITFVTINMAIAIKVVG